MHLGQLLSNNKDQQHNTWHTLLHHVLSVIDTQVALTYITWPSDFALYIWLYLIDKHHTFGTCSVSHCEWPHIFL